MSKREAWHPPSYEQADIRAIQSLALYAQGAERPWEPGEEPPAPTPSDVKRALDWIINHAAGTYDEPFEAGRPDVVAYLLGRRSVGLAIVKLTKLKASLFEKQS
jgi:Isopeptidase T